MAGLLSTLGSVAASAYLKNRAQKIGKAVAPKLQTAKNATLQYIPKSTVPKQSGYQEGVTNIFNGGTSYVEPNLQGGGLVPDEYNPVGELNSLVSQEKQSLLSKDYGAMRSEELYRKNTGKSDVGILDSLTSNFDGIRGKDLFEDKTPVDVFAEATRILDTQQKTKGATPSVRKDIETQSKIPSAIKEIETYKASLKEFNSPSSQIKETLIKAVGKEKYQKFSDEVNSDEMKISALRSDRELRNDIPTWARSITTGLGMNWLTKLTFGDEVASLNRAANYLDETGELQESQVAKTVGGMIGDLPAYYLTSVIGAAAIGEGMVALGATTNSARIAQTGLNVLKMQKTAPVLYNATFDNAFGVATEYAGKKASGQDFTMEDALYSSVMGSLTPVAISGLAKGLESSYKGAKGLFTKEELKVVDDLIARNIEIGNTKINNILNQNRTQKLGDGDGRVLGDVLDEVTPDANPFNKGYNEKDVQMYFSKKGISASSYAGKRIIELVKAINKQVDNGGDANNLGVAMTDLMGKLEQNTTLTAKKVDNIIKEVKETNGVSVVETKVDPTPDDIVSDLLHNEDFDLDKLTSSETLDEAGEAITGKSKVTVKKIDKMREDIDTGNLKGNDSVEAMAKAEGIKYNVDEAFDKVGLVNKTYLHKVLDDIESSVIGYTTYSKRVMGAFREKVTSEIKNLKTLGKTKNAKIINFNTKNVADEGAKVINGIQKDVDALVEKLKVSASKKEKANIELAIAKKNKQIETIKDKNKATIDSIRVQNKAKDSDRKALISLAKSEIDEVKVDYTYAGLDAKDITRIADAHKAMILNKTKLEDVEKIIESLHKTLYNAAHKKVSKEIDKTIKKINKEVTGKKKVSKIDPYYIKLLNDVNEELGDKPSLVKLNEFQLKLELFQLEQRDIRAETVKLVNQKANDDLVKIVGDLDKAGNKRIEMKGFVIGGYNSAEGAGLGRKKNMLDYITGFYERNIQSHFQIDRMFGVGSHGADVFDKKPMRSVSRYEAKKDYVLNQLLPNLLNSIKKSGTISGDNDSFVNKFDLWRRRNSGAHSHNMHNQMILRKDKNGKYQYVALADEKYMKKDDVLFADLDKGERETILKSIYKEFDDEFAKGGDFTKYENELRAHFSSQAVSISDKMRRLVGKVFPSIDLYHPTLHVDKFNSRGVVETNLETSTFTKDVMRDQFKNTRKPPKGKIKISTDLVSNITFHLNTATYWDNLIEDVVGMEKVYNKLKTGKVSDEMIDEDKLFDIERFMKSNYEGESSKLLSKEADEYLRAHIGKIATNGANLRGKLDNDAYSLVSGAQGYIIPMLLGAPKTLLKQFSSVFDTTTLAGTKNQATAVRSMNPVFNRDLSHRNFTTALELSGKLNGRMPPWINNEGAVADFFTQGNLSNWNKIVRKRNDVVSHIFGNMIKSADGMTSVNAWTAGLSKYLDEAHPSIHKAGQLLDIDSIKSKLSPNELEDALAYADKFMSKIMGDTHAVAQGISSQSLLSKGVFFLGKTALNHTMYLFEQVKYIFGKNPEIGFGARASHMASLAISTGTIYAYWKSIDYVIDQLQVMFGSKSEEDIGKIRSVITNRIIEDPSFTDRVLAESAYFLNMMVFSPSTGLRLNEGYDFAATGYTNIKDAPTVGRKLEEASYLTANIAGVNNFWIDLQRSMITEGGKKITGDENFSITKVDNKKFDELINSVYKDVTGETKAPSFIETIVGKTKGGVTLPTGDNLKSLMETQGKINISKKGISEANKSKATAKEEFINQFKSEYGENYNLSNYKEYVKKNKETIRGLGITKESEILSLYTKDELRRAKSGGNEISILKGKPVQVIFDVKVKDYLDNGDKQGAIDEVKQLIKDGVIITNSGIKEMERLILSY